MADEYERIDPLIVSGAGGSNVPPAQPPPINTNPFTSSTPPPAPPSQNVHVHFPNNPVPKFNGDSETFITWKACMMKYIAGVERNLTTILKDGPFVPGNISPVINADGSSRFTHKEKDHYSEEDHRMVDLDNKLQNMILAAVPPSLIPTLVLFENAKTMWGELVTQFEGTPETMVNRKVALNKKYESFFALPKENLTETYIRFTSLVNQLKALGVNKDPEILLEKFCDILPSKWEYLILVLRQGKTLHSHTLNSLYGAFRYTEENSVQRAVDEQNAIGHVAPRSQSVHYAEPKGSALMSSESVKPHSMKKIMCDLVNSGLTDEVTTGSSENDDDDLVAMMAKTFKRFQSRATRPGGPYASSSSVDKTNLTCFKCGKKGHFLKECRSNQPFTKPGMPSTPVPSPAFNKPDDRYKNKYKKLKAQLALMSVNTQEKEGCMMAKTEKWEDSESSSDDEEVRDMCFMALDEKQKHLVKDDIDSNRWVNIIMKKVSIICGESDKEHQMDLLDLLNNDLVFVETVRSESLKLFDTNSVDLSASHARLNELKDVHLALKSQQAICAEIERENIELRKVLGKEQKIVKSWLQIDPNHNCAKSVQYAVPDQRKAYLDGNLNLASAAIDVQKLPEQFVATDFSALSSEIRMVTEMFQPSSEVKTGKAQTTSPVKKANLKKPSPQQTSQKKLSLPKPTIPTSGMAQVSNDESILLRLESQFSKLTSQIQSCNSRLINIESTSSKPMQNAKPFSKALKKNSGKKKEVKASKPIVFVSTEASSVKPSRHTDQKSVQALKGESSEPISRWVPKSNQ